MKDDTHSFALYTDSFVLLFWLQNPAVLCQIVRTIVFSSSNATNPKSPVKELDPDARRPLVLISKCVQNLSNEVKRLVDVSLAINTLHKRSSSGLRRHTCCLLTHSWRKTQRDWELFLMRLSYVFLFPCSLHKLTTSVLDYIPTHRLYHKMFVAPSPPPPQKNSSVSDLSLFYLVNGVHTSCKLWTC